MSPNKNKLSVSLIKDGSTIKKGFDGLEKFFDNIYSMDNDVFVNMQKDLNIYIPKTGQGFKEWINHSQIVHSILNIYDTPSNLVNLLVEEISNREDDILLSSKDFSHLFSNTKLLNNFINKFEVKKYTIIFIFFLKKKFFFLL